ncbi:MAG: hypothetical protein VXV97_12705, partial [Pseudomonadota bacterium]|nr:hypothetical protein [Pseudomonadota bacterium]
MNDLTNIDPAAEEAAMTEYMREGQERAYALDNGESDAIRDNLRLALENLDNPGHTAATGSEYNLVRQ